MEEKLVSAITKIGSRMDKNKLASIVSYFSLTQGEPNNKEPDLYYFKFADDPKFKNWAKVKLNFLGVNTNFYNEGMDLAKKVCALDKENLDHFLEEIKSFNPYERWDFTYENCKEEFKLHYIYKDGTSYCNILKPGTMELAEMKDRAINIDLISLAKYSKAIQNHLGYPDRYFDEIFDYVVEAVYEHEKAHLYQRNLYKYIQFIYEFYTNCSQAINEITTLHLIKHYLKFEHEAWRGQLEKTENSYLEHKVVSCMHKMTLSCLVSHWIKQIYENGVILIDMANATFKVDLSIPNDKLMY